MAPLAAWPVLVVVAGAKNVMQGVPEHYWDLVDGSTCHGEQVYYEKCENMPTCPPCHPKPCEYSAWGNWQQGPGCSGVATKSRTFIPSNSCGKPCTGPLKLTKRSLKTTCSHPPWVDCVLTEWTNWADAECVNQWAQKTRTREVKIPAKDGGKPCEGNVKQTIPCKYTEPPQDCLWGDWSVFTECSTSCGPGRMTRERRVVKEARNGGATCGGGSPGTAQDGGTIQVTNCSAAVCPGGVVACSLTQWSDWRGCDASSPIQKVRSRQIAAASQNGGKSCTQPLKELGQCNVTAGPGLMCELSDWGPWTACDKPCEGGQTMRHKVLRNPGGKGSCAVGSSREIGPCNEQTCTAAVSNKDCRYTDWSAWTQCSTRCSKRNGAGVNTRSRRAISATDPAGLPCGDADTPGVIEEVGSCEFNDPDACLDINCRWIAWEPWSGCTLTCGGGTMRRHRHVSQAPQNDGRKCPPLVKAEITACNTQNCSSGCVDAEWGEWSHWSKCSVTCGLGYMSRTRHVNQAPNECGHQVSGLMQNYTSCTGSVRRHCIPPVNCEVGAYSVWSACTATCFGIQTKTRVITKFPRGEGLPCNDLPTRVIRPCNPILGEAAPSMCNTLNPTKDCVLSEWGDWSDCSETCGRGQRHRVRYVKQPPMHNGAPCNLTLSSTEGCSPLPCADNPNKCIDCIMDTWGEWSACTKSGNQKRRTRDIKQRRNQCGKECTDSTTKELTQCDSNAGRQGLLYCYWGDWGAFTACPKDVVGNEKNKVNVCGTSVTRRHRSLKISTTKPPVSPDSGDPTMFTGTSGTGNIICSGTQTDVQECAAPKNCTAAAARIDCVFTAWGKWTNASDAGLCRRNRHILTVNNKFGTPCDGPLMETKRCAPRTKKLLDCVISDWGMWSQCSSPAMQRFRIRAIRQMPQADGAPCPGSTLNPEALRETTPCARNTAAAQDCALSEWTIFGECSRSCDAGWKIKTRHVLVPSLHGGRPCNGTLEWVEACETGACASGSDTNCLLGQWNGWSGCHQNGQKYQERFITSRATGKGAACQGITYRTAGCTEDTVDCKLAGWTAWMPCTMSCRGGTKMRHRQVNQWPLNGGIPCPNMMNLTELAPCNEAVFCSNSTDCQLSAWTEWSSGKCSVTCGPGQMQRTRSLSQFRSGNGRGCSDDLVQTLPCVGNPACSSADCKWLAWTPWTHCTKSCGGGTQNRKRHNTPPQHGGAECQASYTQEQRSCAKDPCPSGPCIDGQWGEWSNWEACSKTCRGGTTWRSRQVVKTATSCGQPAAGNSQEVGSCNGNIACMETKDCEMSEWSEWTACDNECEGIKIRSRRVTQEGQGDGSFCSGGLKEAAPCNPSTGEPKPSKCSGSGVPVDCAYKPWEAWSMCSVSCGIGQRSRKRALLQPSANGGKACSGELHTTEGCNEGLCHSPCGLDHCIWTAWSSWSPCNKCGGQRTRIRHVTPPGAGGTACTERAAEETTGCPAHCHDHYFCAWSAWEPWSACTGCGTVYKKRRRTLALDVVPAGTTRSQLYETNMGSLSKDPALEERFQQLWRQNQKDEASRTQGIVAAFAAGCLSLLVGLLIMKVVTRRSAGTIEDERPIDMYHMDSEDDQASALE